MGNQRLQGKGFNHVEAPHNLPKSPEPPFAKGGSGGFSGQHLRQGFRLQPGIKRGQKIAALPGRREV